MKYYEKGFILRDYMILLLNLVLVIFLKTLKS